MKSRPRSGPVHSADSRGSELVSFVMPVWNPQPSHLLDAVDSALVQTCDLELIIVDDGNPEAVANLLSGIHDPRLRIVRIPHGGPSRARNAGIHAAKGKWMRFLDSDDVIPSGSTAHLLALAGSDDHLITYGATVRCDERLTPKRIYTCDISIVTAVDCLLGRFTVWCPALLFPRVIVEKTGEWDPQLPISQDWDYVLRALDHSTARGDRNVVLYYRNHAGSNTRQRSQHGVETARAVVSKYFERHPAQRGTTIEQTAKRILAAQEFRVDLASAGKWWRLGAFWRALVTRPLIAFTALPVLVRSSIPAQAEALLFRILYPRQRARILSEVQTRRASYWRTVVLCALRHFWKSEAKPGH